MSMDASLKSASALVRHRNVLTRNERLVQLKDENKWDDAKSVYNLPKVGHRKLEIGKTAKEEADGDAAAAPAAAGKAPAAGTKGAAPAAGAKGAAPAGGKAAAGKAAAPAAGAKAAAPAAKKK